LLSQQESGGRPPAGASPNCGYVTVAEFCLRGIAANKPVLHLSACVAQPCPRRVSARSGADWAACRNQSMCWAT